MNKFDTTAILIIGAIFPIIALFIGIAITLDPKTTILIMTFSYMLGIVVVPNVLYEFANPRLKIYIVAGALGLSFIKLSTKLFAADGKVTEIEIEKLKKYMTKEFGEEIGTAAGKYVKLNAQNKESLYTICSPLSKMSYSERIGIISQLFAMAISNSEFCIEEELVMQKIAHYLKIGKKRYNIIKSNYQRKNQAKESFGGNQSTYNKQDFQGKSYQFLNQFFIPTYNPYIILGLENTAPNDEIKKAFRDLVKKYHPDVIMDKSDQFKNMAKEKFLAINEAYETIKKIRGIK